MEIISETEFGYQKEKFEPNLFVDITDELVGKIKAFIDSVPDADCYILDLRLHEDDHTIDDHLAYTGHRIAQYIYEKNHGAQIVFFTASEKTVNYVASEKYFSGYVIKENPDYLYDRGKSKEVFTRFVHALQKACSNAYLREYYPLCKDISYLDDFFEILRQDDDSNKQAHLINMRSAALNLMVYVESYIKEHFRIHGTSLLKEGNTIKDVSDVYIESRPDSRGVPTPYQMGIFTGLRPAGDWRVVKTENDIALICATLAKYYGLPSAQVNKIIDLKNIRNQSIAHGSGPVVEIKKDVLKDIFDSIIRPMLRKK